MNNVTWQPIEPGVTIHGVDAANNICLDGIQILRGFEYVDGPKQLLTVYENFGKEEASVYLPDDIRLCRAVSAPEPLDQPDEPGWWAFEGSEKTTELVPCDPNDAEGWHETEWDEGDEPKGYYYKRVETVDKPFRTIVEVKWVFPGAAISTRRFTGPHKGDPVLGFVSPKYRWNHALYGLDTVIGKWWRMTLPWEVSDE